MGVSKESEISYKSYSLKKSQIQKMQIEPVYFFVCLFILGTAEIVGGNFLHLCTSALYFTLINIQLVLSEVTI